MPLRAALKPTSSTKLFTVSHFESGPSARRGRSISPSLANAPGLSLGSYPALSLGAARARALTMLAGGPAPTASFKAIADEYLGRATIRTVGWQRDVLSRLVYPAFGDRRIEEIRRSEIARLLDQIEDGSGPAMADATLAVVRRVINWHAARSDDFRSPIVRGMARTKPHERARERVLTDDELRSIWRAADGSIFGVTCGSCC